MKPALPSYEPLKSGADIIVEQRRELEAMRRVVRMSTKPTTYSVKALSLLTLGRGALIRDMAVRGR